MEKEPKGAPVGRYSVLDVSLLRPGENVRDVVKDAAFVELVESVKEHGVLEPILARKADEGENAYEVIAGHRRLAAAKAAKVGEVAVIVHDVGVDVAEVLAAAENMHRANLDPMQEAAAIQKVQARTGDVKLTAQVMKKPVGYIHRSISLLSLPQEITKLIAKGDLTAAHGHEIMRAEEKTRAGLVKFVTTKDWMGRFPAVESLREEIAKKVENDLKNAVFPKDEPYAGEVACTGCPMNSANHAGLFDGAVDGVCVGPSCYAKKERQFYKDFAESNGKKLEAFRFLGTALDRGDHAIGEVRVKGFGVVDAEDKGIKKAMAEKPQAFGWAVMKPSAWSDRKKPWIAFFLVDETAIPKDKRPKEKAPTKSAEEWEEENRRNQHFNNVRAFHLLQAADLAFLDGMEGGKPKQKHLVVQAWRAVNGNVNEMAHVLRVMNMYDPGVMKSEKAVEAAVSKLKQADLLRVIWIASFETWNLEKRLKDEIGLDTAKIVKNADGEAKATWEAMKAAKAEGEKKKVDAAPVKK